MARPATEKKIRLNLDLTERVRERLERLREATEAESMTEVIRRALSIYDALIEIRQEGGKIVVVDKHDKQEQLRFL